MHLVEPYYHWMNLYQASEDPLSPFHGREYSELYFENHIYNYLIHPQWDGFGSSTLFAKIIYVDYQESFAVIEFIGEWNDAIENDIMTLKRDLIDELLKEKIDKFILIGENVLNFHSSDDCYYEEWTEDIDDGWAVMLNLHDHVQEEMREVGIDQYFIMGGEFDTIEWRTYLPKQLYKLISEKVKLLWE